MQIHWSFLGVDGVNVPCPRALDAGVLRYIGKRFDADGNAMVGDPTPYTLTKAQASSLRPYFAKLLRLGQLKAADSATAEAFGLEMP